MSLAAERRVQRLETEAKTIGKLLAPGSGVSKRPHDAEMLAAQLPLPAANAKNSLKKGDGKSADRALVEEGGRILEAALQVRDDAPYACMGGACGTCKARLVAGTVEMDQNFALGKSDLDAGYVSAAAAAQDYGVKIGRDGKAHR